MSIVSFGCGESSFEVIAFAYFCFFSPVLLGSYWKKKNSPNSNE
jgi:hypothetical protein